MHKKIILFLFFLLSTQNTLARDLIEYQHKEPKPIKDIQFVNEGKTINSLNDYLGKVVLINFWATWCQPCVSEMPSISKLKKNISAINVEVIPLSIDFKGADAVKKFYEDNNINNLDVYMDSNGDSFKTLNLMALPTTIIINKEGYEVARVLGEYDWSTKQVKDYLIKLSSD